MKKIISKANFSLLIIAICAMLFCGFIFSNNILTKKAQIAHAESSAMLSDPVNKDTASYYNSSWFSQLLGMETNIQKITITTDSTKVPSQDAVTHSWDPTEAKDGSLTAYLYKTTDNVDELLYMAM